MSRLFITVNGKRVPSDKKGCLFSFNKKCMIYGSHEQQCDVDEYLTNVNPPNFCPLKNNGVTVKFECDTIPINDYSRTTTMRNPLQPYGRPRIDKVDCAPRMGHTVEVQDNDNRKWMTAKELRDYCGMGSETNARSLAEKPQVVSMRRKNPSTGKLCLMIDYNTIPEGYKVVDGMRRYINNDGTLINEYTHITFGKYRGKRFEDIPANYLLYMFEKKCIRSKPLIEWIMDHRRGLEGIL